jgi:hypothetical protein
MKGANQQVLGWALLHCLEESHLAIYSGGPLLDLQSLAGFLRMTDPQKVSSEVEIEDSQLHCQVSSVVLGLALTTCRRLLSLEFGFGVDCFHPHWVSAISLSCFWADCCEYWLAV